MPLSDEELRLLEQMERALQEEDPKFASALRGTDLRRSVQRRAIVAGVSVVVGLVLLMTGVITQMPVISVVGFVVMLGAVTFGLAALRMRQPLGNEPHENRGFTVIDGGRQGRRGRNGRVGRFGTARAPKSGTFMQRMELRWEQRRREW